MIKVVVVDDHEMVRKGIISYLMTESNIQIVGEANSGQNAVQLVIKEKPDIVLMD
ncbi:response regulator transcription factor, partial [Salmonella enterica subsp. enterica serovar Typhi]|nr:response regulator transcription factor [Salmonella enterica subsp. enterica serovar Typhi]